MKKGLLVVLLVVEFCFAAVIGGGSCILTKGQMQAFRDMQANPSDVTKAEFRKQNEISRLGNLVLFAAVFGTLALPTYFIYRKTKRV